MSGMVGRVVRRSARRGDLLLFSVVLANGRNFRSAPPGPADSTQQYRSGVFRV
ncbi:MAG TPA: hypothetical protein VFC82_11645 [Actinomycetaceae bacterium]|nr:hypothetical protein [Actinomycetaceae bacterium]